MSEVRPLNQPQLEDLRTISLIPHEQLAKLATEIQDTKVSIRVRDLQEFCENYISSDQFKSLFRWIYNTKNAKWRLNINKGDIELLAQIIERARLQGVDVDPSIIESAAQISESSYIYAIHNAQRLSYNAEHIFHTAEIIIDTRTVFDESRSEILGQVILPFLKIRYSSDDNENNKSLLLDINDIDLLTIELDRARKKINLIRNSIHPTEALLVGEDVALNV